MKRDLLAIGDLDRREIKEILHKAEGFCERKERDVLRGRVLASCFFEPSTRTRLSFETAMLRLGGSVMGFSEAGSTSSQKGESLEDTMRVVGSFADVIVLRHPEAGSAKRAAEATKTPVINAGDGANEHPSQTLVDLFTIWKSQGRIDGLRVAIMGDLKYGRTVHSLVKALSLYEVNIDFISSKELALPEDLKDILKKKDVAYSYHERIEDVIRDADVVYMTRMQKERLQGELLKDRYFLKKEMLAGCKKNMKILHPLPRVDELDKEIDKTPFAYYFEQAGYGVPVRMALLELLSSF